MEFWISESEKIERRKKWKQDFQSIGQDVYSFFIDTAIEKGFENREGQWDMSFEIVDAMKNQQHILVEAGVGIGKTFAYIVPLLYYHTINEQITKIAQNHPAIVKTSSSEAPCWISR